MKIMKTIEATIPPPPPHMVGDGFRVHNFFPSSGLIDKRRMSPFFLLDYGSKIEFSPTPHQRGVGVHPHAGFETVTLAYHGKVAHHDSAGNAGVIGEGDVQWMTAGSGLLHKEYHEENFSKSGGLFQMVQLWVNLPAKDKMSKPKYQALENSKINRYKSEDLKTEIEIIAGEYKGIKGSASTFTPLHLYNVKMTKYAKTEMNLPKNFNTALLVIEGSITINGTEKVDTNHFALMANDGESFTIDANENAVYLVLSGEPINEPIAAHGPFVMNTRQELVQAFEDFNQGRFGTLEE